MSNKAVLTPAQIAASQALQVMYKAFPNRIFIIASIEAGSQDVDLTSNTSTEIQNNLLIEIGKSLMTRKTEENGGGSILKMN